MLQSYFVFKSDKPCFRQVNASFSLPKKEAKGPESHKLAIAQTV
ncbi:hypothetical protein SAMN04488028_101290 [Reichenbachiella agariperforans]|uniref:Uncharacterized protein n=1 Tax=Reichenbachiella agariperforans TaxID=156994 RepID=A0A1M6JR61_REIAG|nr:hypothetical protein SAMN04488028_101290 [Reichenbachiella agariperforans]